MSFTSTILSQILNEVNNYDFKNQVEKNNGDRKTQIFECRDLLSTMLYSQITKKDSIRDIITGFQSMHQDYYHLGLDHDIKRSTLSYALNNRPYQVFEDYFYKLLSSLPSDQKRKFTKKVKLIDSTTISLCLQKFDWAKYKSTKGGIKLHTMIDFDTLIPEKVIVGNAKVHDIKGIKGKIDFKPDEIYVMDRGYASYKYLYDIDFCKAFFVTRIKDNWKISRTKSREVNFENGILLDENIVAEGKKKKEYSKEMRMVTFHHEESGKVFRFITNNFEMAAEEISELYKSRWQIELFFKWIKQHLKIKSFYSTSENGVLIQIWSMLITYLLILKVKMKHKSDKNIHTILMLVRNFIQKRVYLHDLLFDNHLYKSPMDNDKDAEQFELNFR